MIALQDFEIEDMMKGVMDEERKKCPADHCSQQDQNE